VADTEPIAERPSVEGIWPAEIVAALLQRVWAAPPRAGNTRVLAIEGHSGSGKTTLSTALQAASTHVAVVHLDRIYPGWDGLAESVPTLVDWILAPLAAGRPARYRQYDWERHEYAEWHDVATTDLLIVEGVGSGSRPCRPYLSVLVYLDAPPDLRRQRALTRDGDAYRPHWERWARQEDALFAVHNPADRADVVLHPGFPQVPGIT
jgi:uridine kinase